MVILALDTSTRAGSVAVARNENILTTIDGDASRTHGERLPDEIDLALATAGVGRDALDLLVVATGPGAFTGLRIGLAAIQGLAMVLGVPVVGVSSLDALAAATWPTLDSDGPHTLITWIDAQRDEVFSARYISAPSTSDVPWQRRGNPVVSDPIEILEDLGPLQDAAVFVGDGALRFRTDIEMWAAGRASVSDLPGALAPALTQIGRRRALRGDAGPPHTLQPMYVRRPDAELERLRRTEG